MVKYPKFEKKKLLKVKASNIRQLQCFQTSGCLKCPVINLKKFHDKVKIEKKHSLLNHLKPV